MTRIFDALQKAESSRARAAAPAPVTPLPPPVHPGGAARAAAVPRAIGDGYRAALPLAGSFRFPDDVTREMTALRLTLEAMLTDMNSRVIMFVAPQGGEGTSSVALQFAGVIARDPSTRVLLVDAHVRRPVYHADEAARTAVADPRIAGPGALPGPAAAANLFAVPAPEDILQAGVYRTSELRSVLDATSAGFDWVVIDGPPVLESPDAAALAALADLTLLVVQAGRTKRPVMARSADLLRKSGARLAGSVLNRRVLEIPEFIYRRI